MVSVEQALDKAVVRGFEKEWGKIKKKYGVGSKYDLEMWEAYDKGNEQKVRVMVGDVLDVLNEFAGRLVRANVSTKYWNNKRKAILAEVRGLIKYYEGMGG